MIFPVFGFSQSYKEVKIFYKSGKPMIVNYKNENLDVYRKEVLGPDGTVLSHYNYDPESQLRDGEFEDGINKGSFRNGKIWNCENCFFSFDDPDDKIIPYYDDEHYGKTLCLVTFSEGKRSPNSWIDVYDYNVTDFDRSTEIYEIYDNISFTSRFSISKKLNLGWFSIIRKGLFELNDSSKIDGTYQINVRTKITLKNSHIISIERKNENNFTILKDSIYKESKVWKFNNQYIKSTNYLSDFHWSWYDNPWEIEFGIGKEGDYFFGPSDLTRDPEFPGGQEGFNLWMKENRVLVPAIAVGVKGKVVVQFNISETGLVTDINIKQSLHPACDMECVRVIQRMPVWKPEMKDGSPVITSYEIPFYFN